MIIYTAVSHSISPFLPLVGYCTHNYYYCHTLFSIFSGYVICSSSIHYSASIPRNRPIYCTHVLLHYSGFHFLVMHVQCMHVQCMYVCPVMYSLHMMFQLELAIANCLFCCSINRHSVTVYVCVQLELEYCAMICLDLSLVVMCMLISCISKVNVLLLNREVVQYTCLSVFYSIAVC